jgi:hypothetical protein
MYNWDPSQNLTDRFFVGDYNRFIGAIRLKQVRIKSDECHPAKGFKEYVDFCYSTALHISKQTYGGPSNEAFVWSTDSQESSWNGDIDHIAFPPGGFIEDLALDTLNTTSDVINNLMVSDRTK